MVESFWGSNWTKFMKETMKKTLWTARNSNQSTLKEISPAYSLEGLMLKLKLQYFGHLMWRTDSLEKMDAGKDWRQEEKGITEDELTGWHHWLNRYEFEQASGVGDRQGSLACCSPWGAKSQMWLRDWTRLTDNVWSVAVNFNSLSFQDKIGQSERGKKRKF